MSEGGTNEGQEREAGLLQAVVPMFEAAHGGGKANPKEFMDSLLSLLDLDIEDALRVFAAQGVVPGCKRGCARCCVQPVTIAPMEAFNIADFVLQAGGGLASLRRRLKDSGEYKHSSGAKEPPFSKCVFLRSGICTIYPVRPVACRGYFNLCGPNGERWDEQIGHPLILPMELGTAVLLGLLRETAAPGVSDMDVIRRDALLLEDGVLAVLNGGEISTLFSDYLRRRRPVFPAPWEWLHAPQRHEQLGS